MKPAQKPKQMPNQKPKFQPDMKPVGILGGGQLARMLALKAHDLGIPVSVLSENPGDPAAQVTALWVQGRLDDRKSLHDFMKRCSVVTFESEFLDAQVLGEIQKETQVPVYPKTQDMATLQDRLTQKTWLVKNGLATSEFTPVTTELDVRQVFREFGGKVVFKKRRFGYDGYGTFIARNESDLESISSEVVRSEHGFIAERFVPFKREIAVMAARGLNGKTTLLPFVQTHQENSRCLWVKGPLKETPAFKTMAKKIVKFLATIDYVGIMGIELFDTGRELLVNELAPRVHNSGHYSLDALTTDQFSLHLKALLGLDLGQPAPLKKGFAMYNLLGTSLQKPEWMPEATRDVKLHWYGKSENRPGRKMGHVTTLDATPEKALARLKLNRKLWKI